MNVDPIDGVVGLYEKFAVMRRDGSSMPGGKHERCAYFVLDLVHDPHAVPALRAYAESCRESHPLLSADLKAWVDAQPESRERLNWQTMLPPIDPKARE